MKVLLDKVVCEKIKEETTAGGLVLPGSTQEYTNKYQVIAVGEGILFDNGTILKVDIKVGDIIYAPKAAGYKIDHGGKEYVVIRIDDVLAIVDRKYEN